MDGSSRALGEVRPVASLQKGQNAYLLFVVRLAVLVYSPVNGWTFCSVAYSLQDGCLASICTSDNEDSETKLWGLTAGCCRNGVLVCHAPWLCEARVDDRFDPHCSGNASVLQLRKN